jgi:hypothetical protein
MYSPPAQTQRHDGGVLLPAGVAHHRIGALQALLQFDGRLARGVGDVLVENVIGGVEVQRHSSVERVYGGVGFVFADGGHLVGF